MTVQEEIEQIIKEYFSNYEGRLNKRLKVHHDHIRKTEGDEGFLAFLKECILKFPRPKFTLNKEIISNISFVEPDFSSFKEKPKLNLAIEVLEKELERQNLLIATNEDMWKEIEVLGQASNPRGPTPIEVYPNMLQLRDELESAIAILKTKNNGE